MTKDQIKKLALDNGIVFDIAKAIADTLEKAGCPEEKFQQAFADVAKEVRGGKEPVKEAQAWIRREITQATAENTQEKSANGLRSLSQKEIEAAIALGEHKGVIAHQVMTLSFVKTLSGHPTSENARKKIEETDEMVRQLFSGAMEDLEDWGKYLSWENRNARSLSGVSVIDTQVKSASS